MHSRSPGYVSGDHWNTCQRCGFDYRASQTRKEWTGLIVCNDCYESRHIAELIRPRADNIAAQGLVTSSPADEFVAIGYGIAIPGLAIPGDAIPGKTTTGDTDAGTIPSGTFNGSTL